MPCLIFIVLFLFLLSACTAQYPLNPKVSVTERAHYVKKKLADPERSDQLFLILAFSGGGTRAAALSYGVLEALAKVDIPRPAPKTVGSEESTGRTLLDEIDLISSVSGGSFTAAYFGIHGKDMFKDFRERFLLENHQSTLIWSFLNPFNWPRLASPRFGRSDLAQEYYDRTLFQGATMKELFKGKGPLAMILATDAIDGLTFSFSPSMFSLICSDFDKFPVSRAVTASAAVPGAFTPIILKNYTGKCQARVPSWIKENLHKPDITSRTYHIAKRMNTYLDPATKPYIYLLDGVLSDNLGLRGVMENIIVRGSIRDSLNDAGLVNTRQVAFIIVDAETQEKPRWRLIDEIPGLGAILGVSSTIMINKYNFETIDLLRRYTQEWTADDLRNGKKPIEFHVIHVAFDGLPDKDDREYFHNIPTTLYLPEEQVDRLRDAGKRLLYASEPFRKLVNVLNGKIPGETAPGALNTPPVSK